MNDLMLLREGSNNVWRDAYSRVWDEAINAGQCGCHWHNKQGECVGTAGTTIVTHKGSQGVGANWAMPMPPSAGSSTRNSGVGREGEVFLL